jgi:Kef-type K+ transport system membrane component KefB/nucleotide-binding universal stress UspA family protein
MNLPFSAAPHHDVLVLLVQIAVLLCAARLLGELARRLRQPTVVGELLAGIVLGPSLLSNVLPVVGQWIIPQTPLAGHLLEVVAMIGAMFLMLLTGLETDIPLIRRQARTAIGVSFGGITVTFATGFLLGNFLPDSLLANPDNRLVFALFVATSMSISAIPVIAKVLYDMGLLRRDIGQTIIAAGTSDDTIGWIMLSIVAGLAAGEAVTLATVGRSVANVVIFMVFSFTAGRWLIGRLLRLVQHEFKVSDAVLSLVIVLTFSWGAITQALNLEAVLGAFVMGILFSMSRALPGEVIQTVEKIAMGIFAPIFFAVAGLKVDVRALLEPRLFLISLLVIGVATCGKIAGTYAGARLIGKKDHWTALAYGAGLNARGAMEIIIATIGLSLGILSREMFSIIVLMAMVTSLMAPTMLRWVLSHVRPGEDEVNRLRHEELTGAGMVAHLRRVLLPVRARPGGDSGMAQHIEARILERLQKHRRLAITLMSVGRPEERTASQQTLARVANLFPGGDITPKIITGKNPSEAILDEAQQNYDLLLLGHSEKGNTTEVLFSPIIDFLIRLAPCPTMLVQGVAVAPDWAPRRILVASNGSAAARRAAEVAFAIACEPGDQVVIIQAVETSEGSYLLEAEERIFERHLLAAQHNVETLSELGRLVGVAVTPIVKAAREPDHTVLLTAADMRADLIVLGTAVTIASERLHLGPRVERILASAPCPVVVINS